MALIRRRLRSCAATWLVFQVAWIAALVPRDCCAAHRPVETSCHESAGVAMEHQQPAAPLSSAECRLTGRCDGPMSALVTLLSNFGILPTSTAALPVMDARSAWSAIPQSVIGRSRPPDLPPPRA